MNFIHQELSFVPGMTVLQNIMLGIPKRSRFGMVDWRAIAREVAPIAQRVGITAPLSANVKGLSTAENWLINICRALVRKARLIVMDEPTASLSESESERLFAIVRDLSASGVSVLYVSHRLQEILDPLRPRHGLPRRTVDQAVRKGRAHAPAAGRGDRRRHAGRRRAVAALVRGAQDRARRQAADPLAQGRERQLRPARGRGARPWRPGRRRPHRAGPADLRRRPRRRRRHDAGRPAVCARLAQRGGQGRPRPGARGAAHRGADPDQEHRLQPQPRQPQAHRLQPGAAAGQRARPHGARPGDRRANWRSRRRTS